MSTRIEMPELSLDGEGATLATWLVAIGDRVEKGDVIAELETDKSTVELEAPATGTILEFAVSEGEEGIMPGTVLGSLDADDSGVLGEPSPESAGASVGSASGVGAEPEKKDSKALKPSVPLRESTPLARRAALGRDVDLSRLTGSGPGGRVVEEDVLRSLGSELDAAPSIPSDSLGPARTVVDLTAPYEPVRLSAMRKTIARRMTESKQQVPHFYLRMRCSMDTVIDGRAQLNRDLASEGLDTKISLNDFVIRAAALALRDVPEANVSFQGDVMHVFDRVDVAVAVATDGGLVTPVVRDADRKGLVSLAAEVKALAVSARDGKLRPEQYQGGTFTISNLGMYGIETVYPILNPPQACILGVGAAEEQPVVRHGEIVIGRVAAFTLAADHRAVDGAVGARLMAALRERLEDPLCMML